VEDPGARGDELGDLVSEPREVGRVQGRLDLDGACPHAPAHAVTLIERPRVRRRWEGSLTPRYGTSAVYMGWWNSPVTSGRTRLVATRWYRLLDPPRAPAPT